MSRLPSIPTTALEFEADRTADVSTARSVVADVPDSPTLTVRIAEHVTLVASLTGVDRELTLLAHPAPGVERLTEVDPHIEIPRTPRTQWSVDFYGTVEALGVDPLPAANSVVDVLDVGVGSIYAHASLREYLPADNRPLEAGDELYVPASVVELWGCYP